MSDGITPESVLPDGIDGTEFGGQYVRKGTIRAAIENIKALKALKALKACTPNDPSYQHYADALRDLTPALRALELLDHFVPRDPIIAAILDEVPIPED